MRALLQLAAALALVACTGVAARAAEAGSDDLAEPKSLFSLVLVRHAEKTGDHSDPGLTETGRHRAEFFADWLEHMNIESIWSSDYQRTRLSAQPLAERLGTEIRIYNARNLQELADTLLAEQENAFVSGHSNTTPELAALLCKCEVSPMEDSQYERAFRITFLDGQTGISEIDLNVLWTNRPDTSD